MSPSFFWNSHGDGYLGSEQSENSRGLGLPKKRRVRAAPGGSGSACSIFTGEHDRENAIGGLYRFRGLGTGGVVRSFLVAVDFPKQRFAVDLK